MDSKYGEMKQKKQMQLRKEMEKSVKIISEKKNILQDTQGKIETKIKIQSKALQKGRRITIRIDTI